MSDFEIVPPSEFPNLDRPGRPPSDLSLVLEAGETVFVEKMPNRTRANYLGRRGYRVMSRKAVRNGVAGFYLRAVKAREDVA